jgi:hypothetical protein
MNQTGQQGYYRSALVILVVVEICPLLTVGLNRSTKPAPPEVLAMPQSTRRAYPLLVRVGNIKLMVSVRRCMGDASAIVKERLKDARAGLCVS